ncbi:chitin-binding domain protein cbd-1-like [Octopus sinensis]|uniref:Chitin-binding domain protein cbd-1-like n=1 Tax=Octopus sinensis TaxID=2607531 RepID=A0A6P7TS15_9MOLL|nr:chitin-binding domain protein cbd-1-like [Octopus sinensis]
MKLLVLVLTLIAANLIVLQQSTATDVGVDCSTVPDGYYEISCKSFVQCKNGKKYQHYCKGNTVLDKRDMKCKDPDDVPKPCGEYRDCSKRKDGRYPDLDNKCKSYFTCENGHFMGHNLCPAGLVFSKKLQLCDWPYNVKPPCGTKQ